MRSSILLLLLLAAVLAGCGGPPERLTVGAQAPTFTLESLDGTRVASSSFAGRTVILNFWATWCQPCLKEIPELQEIAAADRAEVVGIALDEEGASAVRPFVERHGIDYPVLLGNQEVFLRYSGFSIPYTLMLDPSQRVVAIYRGGTTRADIERDLDRIKPAA